MGKYFVTLAVAAALVLLGGCQTMEGFGKDVSKVGDKIEKKADEKQR